MHYLCWRGRFAAILHTIVRRYSIEIEEIVYLHLYGLSPTILQQNFRTSRDGFNDYSEKRARDFKAR